MTEDKLTAKQRLRLEALNQANASLGAAITGAPLSEIMTRTRVFEEYIKNGNDKSKQ
jgi:hypothetical protein